MEPSFNKSRIFSLMVVGNNPEKIIEKYSSSYKVEPYVKYKYLSAEKYQKTSIKALSAIIDNYDKIGIDKSIMELLKNRLATLNRLTPFEYYRELTDGLYYNESGDALCDDNPNEKFNTYRIGRNFCIPLKLKDGSEAYSATCGEVDWDKMRQDGKEVYEAAWELVMEGREPTSNEEKNILDSMSTKKEYFDGFENKKDYVDYNTSYWNYAYADENGWFDVDDSKDGKKWVNEFFERFIAPLNANDIITIYECSTNS